MLIKNLNCRFEDFGFFVVEVRLCYDVIFEKYKFFFKFVWIIKFVKNISFKFMMFNFFRFLKKVCLVLFERVV